MALPASVPTGTVTGTWYTPKGDLAVGTIVFLLLESVEVPDDPDGVVIPVKTVVDVPAGVLNQTLPEGMYMVSVRLSELYRITKVIEIVEGVALNLPDAVGLLLPDPDYYDPVRSVNGHFPDQYGNIFVPGGGGGEGVTDHGELTGLADDDHTQYLNNARGDARYAALVHTHAISSVTGLSTALDGKQPSGDYATNTGLSNGLATKQDVGDYATNTALTSGLAGKANTVHTHTIANVTGLQAALDAKPSDTLKGFATSGLITSTFTASSGSGGAWTVAPAAYRVSVAAATGNVLTWIPNVICNPGDSGYELDLVAVDGSGAVLRYKSTGTASPSANGFGGLYLGGGYSRTMRPVTWVVQAGDIVSGNVILTLLYRTGSGMTLGSAAYPSTIDIINN